MGAPYTGVPAGKQVSVHAVLVSATIILASYIKPAPYRVSPESTRSNGVSLAQELPGCTRRIKPVAR